MTKEKAIRMLDYIRHTGNGESEYKNDAQSIALDMAIKALEQEPSEDCISRAELLKAIDTWDKFGFEHTGCFVREPKDDFITYVHYDDVIKCIKGMPSVQPKEEQEPKTGHYKKSLSDGTLLTDTQWKIIHRIDVLYAKGKIFKYIKKPLAWALYQVWKEVAVDIIR